MHGHPTPESSVANTLMVPIYIGHPTSNVLTDIFASIIDEESLQKLATAWQQLAKNIESKSFSLLDGSVKIEIMRVVIPPRRALISGRTECLIKMESDENAYEKVKNYADCGFLYVKGEIEASQIPEKIFKLDFVKFTELCLIENSSQKSNIIQKSTESKLFDILPF